MPMDELTAKAQILIHKPRVEVFKAFIDPQIMSKFWFRRIDQGLEEGHKMSWFIGEEPDALAIDVFVRSILPPELLIIEWGQDNQFTTVKWTFEVQNTNETRLVIEESGFSGPWEEILPQVLASTRGFNQVIVALKALLEYGSEINVVSDHI